MVLQRDRCGSFSAVAFFKRMDIAAP